MDTPTGSDHPVGGVASRDSTAREALRAPLAFLNEAALRIGAGLDPELTLRELGDVVVPRLADVTAVYLIDTLFTPQRLDVGVPTAQDAASVKLWRTVTVGDRETGEWRKFLPEGDAEAVSPENPVRRVMASEEPFLVERVDDTLARLLTPTLGAGTAPSVGGSSLLAVPLAVRGRVLGALLLLRTPDRAPFDDVDALLAGQLAAQAGLSLHHADLYHAESTIANSLQRSMLPRLPARVAGFDVASRYLSSSETAQIGGDWFDAIPLPGGRVALVVGDVMGHGIRSATAMGQFRTAVQTLAALDPPPDHVLRNLDDLAQRLGDNYLATCLYAVYDPVSRRCSVANAGHIPPVLLHADGRVESLDPPTGAPIGLGGVAFESIEVPIEDGDILVLCTDGLVERRGQDINDRLAVMRANLGSPERPLEELCGHLIEALLPENREDDAALLMARLRGIDPAHVVHWFLEPRVSTPSRARRLVRTALAAWGLSEVADLTELLVSEVVTNAVRHASRPIELRLLRTDALLCEVADDNHQRPILRNADVTDEGGRGLQLVSGLARRWGSSAKAGGKVVWFEQELPPSGE